MRVAFMAWRFLVLARGIAWSGVCAKCATGAALFLVQLWRNANARTAFRACGVASSASCMRYRTRWSTFRRRARRLLRGEMILENFVDKFD
jgi:hypothetical protein